MLSLKNCKKQNLLLKTVIPQCGQIHCCFLLHCQLRQN